MAIQSTIGALAARLDRAVERIERGVLAYGVLLMALVSSANVFARNVLEQSLTFTEEVNQILIILITFMGIGYGVRHARHIRMSALYDQLRGRARKGLLLATQAGTAALLLLLAWYAVRYVAGVADIGSVTPALQVPLWVVYLWVPLGLLLGALQYLLAAWRNATSPGVHLSYTRREDCARGEGDAGC